MTTTPAPAPQKTETGTRYVVLQKHADPVGWEVLNANVPATSAPAAVKLALKANNDEAGTYVAVPERSWKPVKVTVETTKTVKLGGA